MNARQLNDTAKAMVSGNKGLLAMDESTPTANKRFAAAGIPQTEEMRRAYRDMIVTAPGLSDCLNGAILVDETIRQRTRAGVPFAKALEKVGIIPGIKVDAGAKPMAAHPGEKITEGLDGLRDRVAEYVKMGARFAKWRAVITIGDGIPSDGCLEANALVLALYAALCQEAGLVPIGEPEVLMDGDGTNSTHRLCSTRRPGRHARRHDSEAQYGRSRIEVPTPELERRDCRCHGAVSAANRAGRCTWDRISLRRPIRPTCIRPA
jgi:fructose-bisphosphate aldolase, class I